MLYVGDATNSYFQGVRDDVVSKSAYLETLVAMGITVESTYRTILLNDPEAWKITQLMYKSDMSSSI